MTSPIEYAHAFERNCPNLELNPDERAELSRLFKLCRDNSRGRQIWAEEIEVIECAQDLVNLWEGANYVPLGRQIKQAEGALLNAMGALAAQCDGQWKAPL